MSLLDSGEEEEKEKKIKERNIIIAIFIAVRLVVYIVDIDW